MAARTSSANSATDRRRPEPGSRRGRGRRRGSFVRFLRSGDDDAAGFANHQQHRSSDLVLKLPDLVLKLQGNDGEASSARAVLRHRRHRRLASAPNEVVVDAQATRVDVGGEILSPLLQLRQLALGRCPFRNEFSSAASVAGDVVFAGALDGRAFAFDRRDGKVLWQFATRRAFQTVNGIDGHGGAIDSPGIVAIDDLVLVPSGYDMFGQMPGNVLLVFQVPPKPARSEEAS